MQSDVLLRVNGLCKRFYGITALSDVTLDLREGEVLAVVGENGAGKSTLIKILAGVYRPDAGSVVLDDHEIDFRSWNPRLARKAGISVIYQDVNLVPKARVGFNILLNRIPTTKILGINFVRKAQVFSEAQKVLTDLGFAISPRAQTDTLSRAAKQQVEIAKALADRSKIIIMDEPTASLEQAEVENLFGIIRSLTANGASVVFVSHRLDEVLAIADRITVLRDGRVVETEERGTYTEASLIKSILGHEIEVRISEVRTENDEVVFEVRGLQASGLGEPVSFDLKRGEILGVTGLLGSGHSELVKAVTGHQPPKSGSIGAGSSSKKLRSVADATRCGLGYVPEDRKKEGLIANMSVLNNIILGNLDKVTTFGFLRKRKAKELIKPTVDALRIKTPSLDTPVMNLSGGNQQKVVLAKWLVSDAQILALIEPTHGIDVGAKDEVHHLLEEFATSRSAVLVSSSEMQEIICLSDRLLVFHKGIIVDELRGDGICARDITDGMFGIDLESKVEAMGE